MTMTSTSGPPQPPINSVWLKTQEETHSVEEPKLQSTSKVMHTISANKIFSKALLKNTQNLLIFQFTWRLRKKFQGKFLLRKKKMKRKSLKIRLLRKEKMKFLLMRKLKLNRNKKLRKRRKILRKINHLKKMILRLKMMMRKMTLQRLKPLEKQYGSGRELMMFKLFGIDPKKRLRKRSILISINPFLRTTLTPWLIFILQQRVRFSSDRFFTSQSMLNTTSLRTTTERAQH